MDAGGRTEAELVTRARRGDEAACAAIVRAHQSVMLRTAWMICGDAAEAEDAVQEALVKALRALGRFRDGEPLRPWLLSIAANEARNRRRAAGRREGLALRAAPETQRSQAGPEGPVLSAERRGALLGALARLPEDQRLVVACRHLLELSERETAAVLDIRTGTVKSRLSRALDRLRHELEEDARVA